MSGQKKKDPGRWRPSPIDLFIGGAIGVFGGQLSSVITIAWRGIFKTEPHEAFVWSALFLIITFALVAFSLVRLWPVRERKIFSELFVTSLIIALFLTGIALGIFFLQRVIDDLIQGKAAGVQSGQLAPTAVFTPALLAPTAVFTPALVPTISPTTSPTRAFTPVFTATPTIFTVTPTKIADLSCTRTDKPIAEVPLLSKGIISLLFQDRARGIFYPPSGTPATTSIDYTFTGSEVVCLLNPSHPKRNLKVDDRIILRISQNSNPLWLWTMDFFGVKQEDACSIDYRPYSMATPTPTATPTSLQPERKVFDCPPQDISSLFTSGRYEVMIWLVDVYPPSYSAEPIYLFVWNPPR